MGPAIHTKHRRRNGVPYAVEQFSGKQFRCRHCNKIFIEEKELYQHLEYISKTKRNKNISVDPKTPQLNHMLELKIGYVYDITDCMRQQYLKLKKDEVYDGIIISKNVKEKGEVK